MSCAFEVIQTMTPYNPSGSIPSLFMFYIEGQFCGKFFNGNCRAKSGAEALKMVEEYHQKEYQKLEPQTTGWLKKTIVPKPEYNVMFTKVECLCALESE